MQESGISYEEVYEAYWQCLEHKGNTIDAIRFEINAEEECRKLTVELNNRTYRPSRSTVFISEKPVKREIFGAAFRDRVVDTVFARRVTPWLEKWYIDDNYSTRVGKGTLYGISRVSEMIRRQSENYTVDCWVMKLDMQSYFMSLPKNLAYRNWNCCAGCCTPSSWTAPNCTACATAVGKRGTDCRPTRACSTATATTDCPSAR